MSKSKDNRILDMIQAKYPGYHPLMSIAEIAHNPDPNITWELRHQCHKTIAKYVESELKSVQIESTDNRPRVTISMFGEEETVVEEADRIDESKFLRTVK